MVGGLSLFLSSYHRKCESLPFHTGFVWSGGVVFNTLFDVKADYT